MNITLFSDEVEFETRSHGSSHWLDMTYWTKDTDIAFSVDVHFKSADDVVTLIEQLQNLLITWSTSDENANGSIPQSSR